ncbi:MAG: nidogen-like domain-containing protein [Sandaracinaceae bacterium]
MKSRLIRSAAAVACVLALLDVGSTAHAVPLLNMFGGPAGYGMGNLPGNDDGSSDAISLTPAFPGGLNFFGGPYNQVWVNNNGNITFSDELGQFTPNAFPVAMRPMIAPYWADVDTRGGGTPTNNGVYWHLEPGRMIVTWHNVGYYYINDSRRMDFQLIITNPMGCRAGDFDVEFRYNICDWEAGRASGDSNENGLCDSGESSCVPAQAGFDAGNSVDFVEIPDSRTSMIRNRLCGDSNVGMPGIWRFSVRGGAVVCPGTGDTCDAGGTGACGLGITQCVGREVVCSAIGTSSMERCDGIDNDCNGEVDEGDLCAAPSICVNGQCVPPCFEGGCPEGQACNGSGVCVDTACESVTCPPGQRCVLGECVDGCAGVTCPYDQQCVAGRCVNLCDVLTCGAGEVCRNGACVPQCPCSPCDAGETCLADGSCESMGCDLTTCDAGSHCELGACVDDCLGAVCPSGQRCEVGACIDVPPSGRLDAGVGPGGDGGAVGPGGDGGISMLGVDGGGRRPPGASQPGCDCTVHGPARLPAWAWLLAPLALLLRRRRRS